MGHKRRRGHLHQHDPRVGRVGHDRYGDRERGLPRLKGHCLIEGKILLAGCRRDDSLGGHAFRRGRKVGAELDRQRPLSRHWRASQRDLGRARLLKKERDGRSYPLALAGRRGWGAAQHARPSSRSHAGRSADRGCFLARRSCDMSGRSPSLAGPVRRGRCCLLDRCTRDTLALALAYRHLTGFTFNAFTLTSTGAPSRGPFPFVSPSTVLSSGEELARTDDPSGLPP